MALLPVACLVQILAALELRRSAGYSSICKYIASFVPGCACAEICVLFTGVQHDHVALGCWHVGEPCICQQLAASSAR